MGNRLSLDFNETETTYDYDAADQIDSVGATSYTYDDNGNVTARGSDTFEWDHENRLTSTTINSVNATYDYNGDGLRMSRTIGGMTADYVWDLARDLPVILEDGDGVRYVYGLDLIARIDGSTDEYYLADGLGSTTGLTDDAGNVTVEYAYDAFGNYRPGEGSSTNEFTYTGEQVDETGLQYLRARYYDPALGRFLSQDPLPFTQRYAYVGNNPANFVDPLGLCDANPFTWGECAGDVVGTVGDGVGAAVDALPYISTGVQIADIVPWAVVPFVNIPATVISVPLDVAAFGLSLYDIWTSDCSFRANLGLTFNSGANLVIGVGGHMVAVIASPTVVGSVAIALTVSAAEGTLYAANVLAISRCEEAQNSSKE